MFKNEKRFYVTITDESLFKQFKVKHESSGHQVFTLEYHGVILVQHILYCQDCQARPHKVFMVKDYLWSESELEGIICHECFEKRLGRRLEIDDLTEYPCNDWLKWRISQRYIDN